jgi:hypothetical protein
MPIYAKRLGHESLDAPFAYLKGKDAESEEAQEHANSSGRCTHKIKVPRTQFGTWERESNLSAFCSVSSTAIGQPRQFPGSPHSYLFLRLSSPGSLMV